MGEEYTKMLRVVIENDRQCDVCRCYSWGCGGGIYGGPNGPVYPPCADGDPQKFVDEDRLEDVYNEIIEEGTKE